MLPSFLYPSPRRLTTPAGIEGQCRSSSPFRRGIQSSMLKVPKASPRSYTVKKPRSTPHSTPTQTPRPNPELTAWTEIRGRKTDNKPQTQAHKWAGNGSGRRKGILKFDGGEEVKPCTECTYLGIKIDQSGDNTTEIKHRISQTRKAINILNSIWWHKNITKNRKLYIYRTIIQSILVYGAEVWQIPTREINKFYQQKWIF